MYQQCCNRCIRCATGLRQSCSSAAKVKQQGCDIVCNSEGCNSVAKANAATVQQQHCNRAVTVNAATVLQKRMLEQGRKSTIAVLQQGYNSGDQQHYTVMPFHSGVASQSKDFTASRSTACTFAYLHVLTCACVRVRVRVRVCVRGRQHGNACGRAARPISQGLSAKQC